MESEQVAQRAPDASQQLPDGTRSTIAAPKVANSAAVPEADSMLSVNFAA